QALRKSITPQLADDLRRDEPRVPEMPLRRHVADEAPQLVRAERPHVPEREIVVAGRMRAARGAAVIAVCARAAGRHVEVIDRRARFVADAAAGGDDAPREIGLEAIRRTGEVLVEAADGERLFAI